MLMAGPQHRTPETGRRVVLICGPPGAGKTTYAHTLGLDVYDLDDPQWCDSEKAFTRALALIGMEPNAQAAVIRSGATKQARRRHGQLIQATETTILDVDAETCIRRITERNRPRPPVHHQVAAVRKWWATYQPDRPGIKPRDPRGTRAWRSLAAQVKAEEPLCWLRLPGCTTLSTTADHVIPFIERPDLAMERSNLHGACKHCNSSRQDKPAGPRVQADALAWFD